MRLVLGLRLEELVAAQTEVGLALAMDRGHVLLEVRQLTEGGPRLLAQQAFEGLLARVLPDVQLQHTRVRKGLPAHLAPVRTLSRVDPLVHHQLGALRERRAAVSAPVGLQLVVDAHVLRQVTLEHLVAHRAVERLDVLMETGQVLVQRVRP